MWVNLSYSDEGKSHGSVTRSVRELPPVARNLQANIGIGYRRDHNNTQWFGNFDRHAGVTHYTFAHLDQRTVSMNVRLNYTVDAGPDVRVLRRSRSCRRARTRTFREVSATPGADSYDDAVPAIHAAGESETRVQVHAAPHATPWCAGSIVPARRCSWCGRTGGRTRPNDEPPAQSWTRDYRDLFALHPDNTFLIKMAYWLNR